MVWWAVGLPGCPKCSEVVVSARLESAMLNRGLTAEDIPENSTIEWSRDGSAFLPCDGALPNEVWCGGPLLWGACGPDEDEYLGTYTIRATLGEDVLEQTVEVTKLDCIRGGGQHVVFEVPLISDLGE